jgi:DNA polymerase zeta
MSAVSPNGMIYAKPHVRKGLLGRMLKELLDTRVMVKHAMKGIKSDKVPFVFLVTLLVSDERHRV